MPRKRIKLDNPTDSEQVRTHIELKAKRSESQLLKRLLHESPNPIRLPLFHEKFNPNKFELERFSHIAAAAFHLRGEIAAEPCNNCLKDNGPFRNCVVISGFDELTNLCCTNCCYNLWTSLTCSKRGQSICSFAEGRSPKPRPARPKLLPNPFKGKGPDYQAPYIPETIDSNITNPRINDLVNSSENQVHILGDLWLPRPKENDFQQLLYPVLSGLSKLHQRNMQLLEKPILDLNHSFKEFIVEEARAWIAAGHPSPPPEYLVKPSGSFDSPISHRLNQPSFTCSVPENSETADPSNGCIQMVMGTAYTKKTLLYDMVHRRDMTSEGYEKYPEAVRTVHAKWTQRIWESSEAKVEVVYGEKCFKSLISKVTFTRLPLWGDCSGVVLHLIHEEDFRNAQEGFKYRKVVIFAHHPQHLFFLPAEHPRLIHQEKILTVAAAIAGVEYQPRYCADRMFLRECPKIHQRHFDTVAAKYEARGFDFNMTNSYRDDASGALVSDIEEMKSVWEQAFEEKAHNIHKLFELLPDAIDATKMDGDWASPKSFPLPVLDWWKGQKQFLFFRAAINNVGDILSVLGKCGVKMPSTLNTSTGNISLLRPALQKIMEIQYRFLSGHRALKRQEAPWYHPRFGGDLVRLKCRACNQEGKPEKTPLYSVNRPGHLVALNKQSCKDCDIRRIFIPIDVPWIFGTPSSLQSTAPVKHWREALQLVLAPSSQLKHSQQRPVEIICLSCQDKSESGVFIDKTPTWTLGHERPLYVGPRRDCKKCQKIGNLAGRWIPKDASIPTISSYTLGNLAACYGNYTPFVIASLLDHWPPSTRKYRMGEDI